MNTSDLSDAAWIKYPFTYRNNRGCIKMEHGYVRYGIPEPKGSQEDDNAMKGGDRIGFSEVIITSEMVGRRVAIFTNIEIKGPGDKLKPGQIRFHNFVIDHGGISEIWKPDEIIGGKIEQG